MLMVFCLLLMVLLFVATWRHRVTKKIERDDKESQEGKKHQKKIENSHFWVGVRGHFLQKKWAQYFWPNMTSKKNTDGAKHQMCVKQPSHITFAPPSTGPPEGPPRVRPAPPLWRPAGGSSRGSGSPCWRRRGTAPRPGAALQEVTGIYRRLNVPCGFIFIQGCGFELNWG